MANRATVCMVVHAAYPHDVRVQRAVRVALREGYDVDVVAVRQAGESAHEIVEGARVRRLPLRHNRGAGLLGALWEYAGFTALAFLWLAVQTPRRRYRVVHVNNPPDFLVVAALAPRALGARVILDIHDFSPEMFSHRFGARAGAGPVARLLRMVEKLATRFADAVITVHEPYRRLLAERGVPGGKLTVVMNTVDEEVMPARSMAPRSRGFRAVYHGSLTPHYGIDLLAEAAARAVPDIPDLRLEIYGGGDAFATVAARVDELGIAERTTLSGRYVAHAEILSLVSSADVGVIPNRPIALNEHALPTKLFEYVALGVPVVCADLPTIREHFSDEQVLFYRAGDPEALAAALTAVARNPAAAADRAEAALRRYDAYRWSISARRYASVLAACAARRGPVPAGPPLPEV